MEKLGIDNLKKAVDLACELEKIGVGIVKNGKNLIADAQLLFGEFPVLSQQIPAMIAAAPQIIPEVKDLDPAEAAEIVAYTVAKLSINDEKAVKIINASIKLVVDMYQDGMALSAAIRG